MMDFYINSESNKQIKDNEVLFIGCSHTEGDGHGKINEKAVWVGPYDTVYTHIFCKALALIPKVDAHRGEGNALTEEKLNTYDLKNKKVIIQFTDQRRLRLNGKNITIGVGNFSRAISEVFTDEVFNSLFCEQVKRIINLLKANNCQFLVFKLDQSQRFADKCNCLTYEEFVHIPKESIVDKANDNYHHGFETMKNIANILLLEWHKLYIDVNKNKK